MRVFCVLDLVAVRAEEAAFMRSERFDLATFWQGWCAAAAAQRQHYPVVRIALASALTELPFALGDSIRSIRSKSVHAGTADAEGWVQVSLLFDSFLCSAGAIAQPGVGCEVPRPRRCG